MNTKKLLSKTLCLSTFFILAGISNSYCHADTSSALDRLIYQLRDPETDPKDFRDSLKKIGEYLALDVFNELKKEAVQIKTLTGATATHQLTNEDPVLITILRAGIPLYLGVQEVFPYAKVGFLGMSRNEATLEANTQYIAIPDVKDKCVVIIDTMIATGGSIIDAIQKIESYGPRKIIVLGAVASEPGIKRILKQYPNITIFTAVTDPTLNDKGYIVPGLGDAGDRAYGTKYTIHKSH